MSIAEQILAELREIKERLNGRSIELLTREQAAGSMNMSIRSFDDLIAKEMIAPYSDVGPVRFSSHSIEQLKLNGRSVVSSVRPKREYKQKAAS